MTATLESMFSTREVPWMTIGKLTETAVTSDEAAKLGGLNFTVSLRQDYYEDQDGNPRPWPHRRAIVRDDTDEPFEVVSADYTVCQYGEAFKVLDRVSDKFVAAGVLRGGKQGFMVIEAPDDIRLNVADDPHDLYVVARTSHDRSRALEISVMPLRVRCMNQLTLQSFSANAQYRWSIVHNTNMHDRIAEAERSLEKLGTYASAYGDVANRLLEMNVSEERARKVFARAVQSYIRDESKEERVDRMVQLWKNAETVGFGDNAWGVVQAVSEYYQWDRLSGNTTPESKFIGALQGELHKLVNKAVGALLTRRA